VERCIKYLTDQTESKNESLTCMHIPSSHFELQHSGSKNRSLKKISFKEHPILPRQFLFTVLSSKAYAMVPYCKTDIFFQ